MIALDEKCFLFRLKSSFCSQDIENFLSLLFGHVEKMVWLEVNFEIYYVKAWLTKNYNTHIAQYLTN